MKHVVEISSMGAHTDQGTGIVAGLARQERRHQARQAMVGMGLSPSVADSFVVLNRAFNENDLFRAKTRDAKNTTPTSLEEFAPVFMEA